MSIVEPVDQGLNNSIILSPSMMITLRNRVITENHNKYFASLSDRASFSIEPSEFIT